MKRLFFGGMAFVLVLVVAASAGTQLNGGARSAEAHFGTHGSTVTVIGHAYCGYVPGVNCSKVKLTVGTYSRTQYPGWTGRFTFTGVPHSKWGTLYMERGGFKCTKSVYINDPWFGTVDLHGLWCRG